MEHYVSNLFRRPALGRPDFERGAQNVRSIDLDLVFVSQFLLRSNPGSASVQCRSRDTCLEGCDLAALCLEVKRVLLNKSVEPESSERVEKAYSLLLPHGTRFVPHLVKLLPPLFCAHPIVHGTQQEVGILDSKPEDEQTSSRFPRAVRNSMFPVILLA